MTDPGHDAEQRRQRWLRRWLPYEVRRRLPQPRRHLVAEIERLRAHNELIMQHRREQAEAAKAAGRRYEAQCQAWSAERTALRKDLAALHRQIDGAYEPVQVGECHKVRYTRQEDAAGHAAQVAVANPGSIMNAYRCRVCPKYRLTKQRPWHAGGTGNATDTGAMWADADILYHYCGCRFGITDDMPDLFCEAHRVAS